MRSRILFSSLVILCAAGCGSNNVASSSKPASPAPTVSLSATPGTVDISQPVTLEWQTTNASTVTIDPIGAQVVSGTMSTTPTKTTTYNLIATGPGGSNSTSVTVTVLANAACWGDSLTAGDGGNGTTYPGVLAQLSGMKVLNSGVGGQTSTQIAARMLADTADFGDVTIIWAGNNNATDPAAVQADVASMIGALSTPKNFLVLSLMNGNFAGESAGGPIYEDIVSLNHSLNATYPNNFLDVRELLITQGLSFEGITPTAQDQSDIANDIPPSSLRNDAIHLNSYGYDFVGHKVNDFLKANSMEKIH